jgi:hypothetical protein
MRGSWRSDRWYSGLLIYFSSNVDAYRSAEKISFALLERIVRKAVSSWVGIPRAYNICEVVQ